MHKRGERGARRKDAMRGVEVDQNKLMGGKEDEGGRRQKKGHKEGGRRDDARRV